MRAGQLDKRITIQEEIRARDSLGGYSTTLDDRWTCWARIVPFTSDEPYLHDQKQREITHRITTRRFTLPTNGGYFGERFFGPRYFGDHYFGNGDVGSTTEFNASMFVKYKTRRFRIVGIRDIDEDNITTDILAQELPA